MLYLFPFKSFHQFTTIENMKQNMKQHLTSLIMAATMALSGTAFAFEQPPIYQLKPKDQVLILGDSTTAGGVLVGGYVRLVDQAQNEQRPDQGIVVRGIGHSGATMTDMLNGLPGLKTLFAKPAAPSVVIVNFGLNDSKGGEVNVPAFTESVRKMVEALQQYKVTVILCTPTTWGGLTQTKSYAEAVRTVAAELKIPLIDLYATHADHITSNTKDGQYLSGTNPTTDGTHLSMVGETLSASAILQGLGLKPTWQRYQLRLSMGRVKKLSSKGKIKVVPDQASNVQSFTNFDWTNIAYGKGFEFLPNVADIPNPGEWHANWPTKQASFASGTKVALAFEPDADHTFVGWESKGGPVITETSPTLNITMDRHLWIFCVAKPSGGK